MKLELMKNYRKKQYVIVDTDNDDEVIIRFSILIFLFITLMAFSIISKSVLIILIPSISYIVNYILNILICQYATIKIKRGVFKCHIQPFTE